MPIRLLILPLFAALSMVAAPTHAKAEDKPITRCAQMRFNQNAPELIGYAMKRIKLKEIDIGEQPVIVQPAMAGLRGPRLTLLGRDVRLAVTTQQISPQELWHRANWNQERVETTCQTWPKRTWKRSLAYGLHWKFLLDHTMGVTDEDPSVMYRTRVVSDAVLMRPYGFTFGAALSLGTSNADSLVLQNDPRPPVRRDIAHFSAGAGLEKLYASWRTTPLTDVHVAVSGGYLEEMYAGAGMEAVWRPFESPFWLGADAWKVWRRDPTTVLNARVTDHDRFTGHVRAGYDIPDTRATLSVAAGQYLAGDKGATLQWTQDIFDGLRLDAGVTWTEREEDHGFLSDTHFEPMVRVTWDLGGSKHYEARATARQIGRDGGQMLDRPLPLEILSEKFSAREMARHWPAMLK